MRGNIFNMDTDGTELGVCTTEVSVLYSNGKCIKLALLEPSKMSIIEKCLYSRGVGKKRCDCTIDFMAIIICNANRTEWSPIWSVIIRVVNKIGRLREWHVLSNYWTVHAIDAVKHDAYFLLRLKSGHLITNQIWEFCYSYDYNFNRSCFAMHAVIVDLRCKNCMECFIA